MHSNSLVRPALSQQNIGFREHARVDGFFLPPRTAVDLTRLSLAQLQVFNHIVIVSDAAEIVQPWIHAVETFPDGISKWTLRKKIFKVAPRP